MTTEKNKGLLVGFLAGGVIGSIIALLYAPKSGKEVRQDIKVKSDELLDEANTYYNEARKKTVELWDEGRKKAVGLVDDVRTKASSLLSKTKDDLTAGSLMEASEHKTTGSRRSTTGSSKNSLDETINANKEALKSGWEEGTEKYKEEKSSRLRK